MVGSDLDLDGLVKHYIVFLPLSCVSCWAGRSGRP
jgi:hypothetical protein